MRSRWPKSLRVKIMLSLVALIIIPVFLIVYQFYASSRQILESQLYQSNQTSLERRASAMNELATRIVRASNMIYNDTDVPKFLRDEANWTTDYTAFYNYISLLRKFSLINDFFQYDRDAYVALYDFRGYVHSPVTGTVKTDLSSIQAEPWFDKTARLLGSPTWTMSYKLPGGTEQSYLLMTRLIHSVKQSGEGVIAIGVPADMFFYSDEEKKQQAAAGIHSLLFEGSELVAGDVSGIHGGKEAILHAMQTNESGIKRLKTGNEQYLVNAVSLSQQGWTVVQLMDRQTFGARLNQAKNNSLSWVVLWFIVLAIGFIGLMFRFTKPIKQLVKSMDKVGKGDLETVVDIRGQDELAVLGKQFNKMTGQLQELVRDLSEEQQRKQKAQFQALQAQINPHFLLNTMNSIKWMAILSGAGHVSEMLTKLGKLLNYTMRQHEDIVSLRDELDYLNVYLSLQEIRYHDNIAVDVDVPEELLDTRIVKFTLQPIVENSIMHGNRSPLKIGIRAYAAETALVLELRDNGVGMSEEALRRAGDSFSQPHAKFSGIGIRNVNERIKLEFGPQYGIAMENGKPEGLLVTVTLPNERRLTDAASADCG